MTEADYADAIALLSKHAFDAWTIGAAVAVYLAVAFCSRAVEAAGHPRLSAFWQRFIPIAPEFVAVPCALLGGVPGTIEAPWPLRFALGMWIAYLATKSRKILGQTILGDDAKLDRLLGYPQTRLTALQGGAKVDEEAKKE